VTLVLADMTLVGAVISGGAWQGRSSYRIVGGAGGWCQSIPAKAYVNDAGVKISKVAQDAAEAVGETLADVPTGTCGLAFDRFEGPASNVLHLVAPQSWYVGEDGVTRFGARAASTLSSSYVVESADIAGGYLSLMADSIAAIVPGVVVESVSAVDVVHTLDSSKLRSQIWGSAFGSVTKRLAAWSRIIEQLRPFDRYRGTWEYRVVYQNGERLDLQPAASRFGLPDLRSVRVRPGLAGCRADVTLGSLVLVTFVNADPSRPVVIAFDDPDSVGFEATRIDLAGDEDTAPIVDFAGRVVRYGDVICMPTGTAATPILYQVSGTAALTPSPVLVASRVRA
jgi:hypothetical protein